MGLKGETPIGIFPFFYQKTFIIKGVFSPPPKTAVPYLGPLIVDYDTLKQDKKESIYIEFQKEIDKLIFNEINPSYVSFSLPPGFIDARPFKWSGYKVTPNYNYVIDLSKGIDKIWMDFKKELRGSITETEKKIHIIEGHREELEFIYNSLFNRYNEQDITIPLHKEYLLELYDFFSDNFKIFIAKYNGEVISGRIVVYYKNKAATWIGSARPNLKGISPNDLVQWETIKWAHAQGFKYCELMGAGTQRLISYKSKCNPDITVCFEVKKSTLLGNIAEKGYNILKTRRL
ncbi:MAG: hypothetical protein BWK75_02825 [Candidatus Altiarchaeales archaeon A3]|nr:MAG: hypothetical protein BWK75_02825 [Candidatus Altiarchaeales archaeon A3]